MKNLDLSRMVENVMSDYTKEAQEKGLETDVISEQGQQYMVHVDEKKTRNIIASVVDNAIKYTKKGWVKLELEKLDGKVRLSIKDTGIGIDKKDQKKIFDKFFRTTRASDVFVRGTGLGLYIAKHTLRAQGANIWVSSKGSGYGSTFVIEFDEIG